MHICTCGATSLPFYFIYMQQYKIWLYKPWWDVKTPQNDIKKSTAWQRQETLSTSPSVKCLWHLYPQQKTIWRVMITTVYICSNLVNLWTLSCDHLIINPLSVSQIHKWVDRSILQYFTYRKVVHCEWFAVYCNILPIEKLYTVSGSQHTAIFYL